MWHHHLRKLSLFPFLGAYIASAQSKKGCREDSCDRHETTPESPRHLFRVVKGLSQTDSSRKKSKGIAEKTSHRSAEEDDVDVDVIRLEWGITKCHFHSNEV